MDSKDIRNLQEAYLNVYDSDLREEQEFKSWVTELLDEGYDLSDYTWDEMYEIYNEAWRDDILNEGIGSAIKSLFSRSKPKQSRGEELRSKYGSPARFGRPPRTPSGEKTKTRYDITLNSSGKEAADKVHRAAFNMLGIHPIDDGSHKPGTVTSGELRGMGNRANRRMGKPPEDTRDQESLVRMGRGSQVQQGHIDSRGVKKPISRINASYEPDLFDVILEYLITEGYADTNESALAIMVNMSEDWRESICEANRGDEYATRGMSPEASKTWKSERRNRTRGFSSDVEEKRRNDERYKEKYGKHPRPDPNHMGGSQWRRQADTKDNRGKRTTLTHTTSDTLSPIGIKGTVTKPEIKIGTPLGGTQNPEPKGKYLHRQQMKDAQSSDPTKRSRAPQNSLYHMN